MARDLGQLGKEFSQFGRDWDLSTQSGVHRALRQAKRQIKAWAKYVESHAAPDKETKKDLQLLAELLDDPNSKSHELEAVGDRLNRQPKADPAAVAVMLPYKDQLLMESIDNLFDYLERQEYTPREVENYDRILEEKRKENPENFDLILKEVRSKNPEDYALIYKEVQKQSSEELATAGNRDGRLKCLVAWAKTLVRH